MSGLPDPYDVDWNVRTDGYGWREQAIARYELTPEKLEMVDGKLCGTDADRLRLLGLLLENCGANVAVRFGDPNVWRRAVAALDNISAGLGFRVEAMLRQWDDIGNREDARVFYAKWVLPDFLERAEGLQRDVEMIVASYPDNIDWHDCTYYNSRLTTLEIVGSSAAAQAIRKGTIHRVVDRLVRMSSVEEHWDLQWRNDRDGWQLAGAELLNRTQV